MHDTVTSRFDEVCGRLADAVARAERSAGTVRLVAVSKWHGADSVARLADYWAAYSAEKEQPRILNGPIFGESYVQEALCKIPEVLDKLKSSKASFQHSGAGTPDWHFIGHLQSRKAKEAIGNFSLIHSVDSIKLVHTLQKAWEGYTALSSAKKPQEVLIQVNIGREPQKSGVLPEALEALLLAAADSTGLLVSGLMCLPPVVETTDAARAHFAALRQLRDTMQSRTGLALPELSMGMSYDFVEAVLEGATFVRIGTDIFGPREY